MAIKVRSSAGDQESNVTTVQVDSPATITAGDLLVIRIHVNDDRAQTVTPPSGFTLNGQASDATANSRVMEWSKTADATDVTNAGTVNYYDFTGFANATDDYLFCCFSIYDDAGGTVTYAASSLAGVQQSGGTSSQSPTQTISETLALCLCSWTARGGATPFNISVNETFSEANLTNEALYQDAWVAKGQSGSSWAVGTGEATSGSSPTGTLDLSHDSVSGSTVYGVSSQYEVIPTGSPWYYYAQLED